MYMNSSGFIAQLVRASHRYREVTGYNTVEDPNFFLRLLTELRKFRSQLLGPRFIWFSLCTSYMFFYGPGGNQTWTCFSENRYLASDHDARYHISEKMGKLLKAILLHVASFLKQKSYLSVTAHDELGPLLLSRSTTLQLILREVGGE